MILDGYSVAEKKIISFDEEAGFDTQEQIQPNGIDLRAGRIYEIQGKAKIPRDTKAEADFQIRDSELKDGYWTLSPKGSSLYYVDFLETCFLLDGYSADIKTRSSLVRAGVDIVCGWWDCGWNGRLGASLRVYSDITVEYGARLGQIIVYESAFRGMRYTGRYLNTDSQTAVAV